MRVSRDLRGRLDYPEREAEVLIATLAHELAHIELHAGKRPQAHHEIEAWVWSVMFLAPWWRVGSSDQVRAIESGLLSRRQRWSQIYSLARELKVSASLLSMALRLYGVAEAQAHGRAA